MNTVAAAFHFRFEEDFIEDGIRCVPMAVRYKLDKCGIKLKLAEWSKLNELERRHLAYAECELEEEVIVYRSWLQMAVFRKTGSMPTDLPSLPSQLWLNMESVPEVVEEMLNESDMTLSISQWAGLSILQRFALVKLSRQGHENRNFPLAVKEFLADDGGI
jgi:hypothetical protein